jgi:hypothetical protein
MVLYEEWQCSRSFHQLAITAFELSLICVEDTIIMAQTIFNCTANMEIVFRKNGNMFCSIYREDAFQIFVLE